MGSSLVFGIGSVVLVSKLYNNEVREKKEEKLS